jgi:hypothetical protein
MDAASAHAGFPGEDSALIPRDLEEVNSMLWGTMCMRNINVATMAGYMEARTLCGRKVDTTYNFRSREGWDSDMEGVTCLACLRVIHDHGFLTISKAQEVRWAGGITVTLRLPDMG